MNTFDRIKSIFGYSQQTRFGLHNTNLVNNGSVQTGKDTITVDGYDLEITVKNHTRNTYTPNKLHVKIHNDGEEIVSETITKPVPQEIERNIDEALTSLEQSN